MVKMAKEEIEGMIYGMSQEELELIADIMPIDICMTRVKKEMDRLRNFEDSVRSTVNGMA